MSSSTFSSGLEQDAFEGWGDGDSGSVLGPPPDLEFGIRLVIHPRDLPVWVETAVLSKVPQVPWSFVVLDAPCELFRVDPSSDTVEYIMQEQYGLSPLLALQQAHEKMLGFQDTNSYPSYDFMTYAREQGLQALQEVRQSLRGGAVGPVLPLRRRTQQKTKPSAGLDALYTSVGAPAAVASAGGALAGLAGAPAAGAAPAGGILAGLAGVPAAGGARTGGTLAADEVWVLASIRPGMALGQTCVPTSSAFSCTTSAWISTPRPRSPSSWESQDRQGPGVRARHGSRVAFLPRAAQAPGGCRSRRPPPLGWLVEGPLGQHRVGRPGRCPLLAHRDYCGRPSQPRHQGVREHVQGGGLRLLAPAGAEDGTVMPPLRLGPDGRWLHRPSSGFNEPHEALVQRRPHDGLQPHREDFGDGPDVGPAQHRQFGVHGAPCAPLPAHRREVPSSFPSARHEEHHGPRGRCRTLPRSRHGVVLWPPFGLRHARAQRVHRDRTGQGGRHLEGHGSSSSATRGHEEVE